MRHNIEDKDYTKDKTMGYKMYGKRSMAKPNYKLSATFFIIMILCSN